MSKDLETLGALELRLGVCVFVEFVSLHQVLAGEDSLAHVTLGWEPATLAVMALEVRLQRYLAWAPLATQAASTWGYSKTS